MGPELGRRRLLAAAALVPLAACTREPAPPPPPDPDDLLRSAAAERERALLGRYDAALAAQPALAARLTTLRAEHAEHLLALTGPPPSATPSPSPTASAVPLPPEVPPPATAAEALSLLITAEQEAGGEHAAAAVEAGDRELAALLASLAASERSHPVALS